MSWKGQVTLGNTLYFLFTTRRFSTGAPYTLAGTPVLSCYEENNTTQITTGVSITADYDSVTGLNQATVVASGANGYETGKRYDVVITTGTVDSVSVVGEVVGSFMVGPAEANVVQFGGTTVTARDIGASVLLSSGTGTGQLDFTSGVVKANATQIGSQTASASGTVTFPNATLASTTNITAAAGCAVSSIGSNVITSASIQDGAITDAKVADDVKVDLNTIKGQTVTCSGGVTVPAATLASTTNITSATGVTVATNSDKTGYSLTQTFPSNFSSMAITVGGAVTVGTNNDKTGYTASTVSDKTGYSLAADQSGVTVGTVNALGTTAKSDVNAEVKDVLDTDTYAELGSVPAATSSLKDKLTWIFMLMRNKLTQTSTTSTLRNDADGADVSTSTVSDSGTTFTRGEWS